MPSVFQSPSCGVCLQVCWCASDKFEGLQSLPTAGSSLEVSGRTTAFWWVRHESNLTLGAPMGDVVFAAVGCQSALVNRISGIGVDLTQRSEVTGALINSGSIFASDSTKSNELRIGKLSCVLKSQPENSACLSSARLQSAPETALTVLVVPLLLTGLSSPPVILSMRFDLLTISSLSGAHQRVFPRAVVLTMPFGHSPPSAVADRAHNSWLVYDAFQSVPDSNSASSPGIDRE